MRIITAESAEHAEKYKGKKLCDLSGKYLSILYDLWFNNYPALLSITVRQILNVENDHMYMISLKLPLLLVLCQPSPSSGLREKV